MTDTVTVTLSASYTLAGKPSNQLTFRRPELGDLIIVESAAKDGGQHAVNAVMMAQLSGATQPEIAKLSIPDYAACDRALRPFIQPLFSAGGG